MERLRSVARATGAGPGLLVREAAGALASLGPDPAGRVIACRRLVERHPGVGPVWWLASRVLCASDPVGEAGRAAAEIEADPTPAALAAALPEEATAVVVGWPEQVVEGVRRRGDVAVLSVSGGGESTGLARRLRAADTAVWEVSDAGLGAAAAGADLVVLEAAAMGDEWFVAAPGSRAAAAVARSAGVAVWVVAGVGRCLPAPLWSALEARLDRSRLFAWERAEEFVPLSSCDTVVGPSGPSRPGETPAASHCPVAPELLKPVL